MSCEARALCDMRGERWLSVASAGDWAASYTARWCACCELARLLAVFQRRSEAAETCGECVCARGETMETTYAYAADRILFNSIYGHLDLHHAGVSDIWKYLKINKNSNTIVFIYV